MKHCLLILVALVSFCSARAEFPLQPLRDIADKAKSGKAELKDYSAFVNSVENFVLEPSEGKDEAAKLTKLVLAKMAGEVEDLDARIADLKANTTPGTVYGIDVREARSIIIGSSTVHATHLKRLHAKLKRLAGSLQ